MRHVGSFIFTLVDPESPDQGWGRPVIMLATSNSLFSAQTRVNPTPNLILDFSRLAPHCPLYSFFLPLHLLIFSA
jgi:hypothetical protein